MPTKTQGECSEGIILAHLLKLGYAVSLPFGNNQRYDMIVDIEGGLLRAQCKTGRLTNGVIYFAVASKHWKTSVRHSYRGQIEIFLVYCPQTQEVYKVPIELTGRNSMVLRVDPPLTQANRTKIKWAKDYLI